MGLSRDQFLTYCYFYMLLAQRVRQNSLKGLASTPITKMFENLWAAKEKIKEVQVLGALPISYFPPSETLRIPRADLPSLAVLNDLTFMDPRGPISQATILSLLDDPFPSFIQSKTVNLREWLKDLAEPINDKMEVNAISFRFEGILIYGYQNHVLWFSLCRDEQTIAEVIKAANEWEPKRSKEPLSFPAAKRARWIRSKKIEPPPNHLRVPDVLPTLTGHCFGRKDYLRLPGTPLKVSDPRPS